MLSRELTAELQSIATSMIDSLRPAVETQSSGLDVGHLVSLLSVCIAAFAIVRQAVARKGDRKRDLYDRLVLDDALDHSTTFRRDASTSLYETITRVRDSRQLPLAEEWLETLTAEAVSAFNTIFLRFKGSLGMCQESWGDSVLSASIDAAAEAIQDVVVNGIVDASCSSSPLATRQVLAALDIEVAKLQRLLVRYEPEKFSLSP